MMEFRRVWKAYKLRLFLTLWSLLVLINPFVLAILLYFLALEYHNPILVLCCSAQLRIFYLLGVFLGQLILINIISLKLVVFMDSILQLLIVLTLHLFFVLVILVLRIPRVFIKTIAT